MNVVEPKLSIVPDDTDSAYAQVDVDYTIRVKPGDVPLGEDGRVVVFLRAAGPGDPKVHGTLQPLHLVLADEPVVVDGFAELSGHVRRRVHRRFLDVDQDWWRSDEDGQPMAIAEFSDRLIAQVEVRRSVTIAASRTNVFVGSFGPLAHGS